MAANVNILRNKNKYSNNKLNIIPSSYQTLRSLLSMIVLSRSGCAIFFIFDDESYSF